VNTLSLLVVRIITGKLVFSRNLAASDDCTDVFKVHMNSANAILATAEWNLAVVVTATRMTNADTVSNDSRGLSIHYTIYTTMRTKEDKFEKCSTHPGRWDRNTTGYINYKNERSQVVH
jgi:hypothetical protein